GLFQTSRHYIIFILTFIVSSTILFVLLQVFILPTFTQNLSLEAQIPAILFLVVIPALSVAIIVQTIIKNRQNQRNTYK
ncbi:MAG: hypothetical protein ACFFBD_19260, partial [Candidatus Hodarchaeota archaeon]